jgi:hypothetical protein
VDDLKWLPTDKEENGSQIKDSKGTMEDIDGHLGRKETRWTRSSDLDLSSFTYLFVESFHDNCFVGIGDSPEILVHHQI